MLNFEELDKKYKVEIRRNSYGYLYHYDEVIPSDIKTISVSESYKILKENNTIFIPVLEDKEILNIIYELNENLFPNSNVNRRVLYIKGLETKIPWKIDIDYPNIKNFTVNQIIHFKSPKFTFINSNSLYVPQSSALARLAIRSTVIT